MPHDSANVSRPSAWRFFALLYALSVPWWILAQFVRIEGLPDELPITDAGATFMPLLAAVILVARESGAQGVTRLLARILDFQRISGVGWWAITLLIMPAILVLTYMFMRMLGMSLPDTWSLPATAILVFLLYFLAAVGEEVGYTGYATGLLQQRTSPLLAALIIGTLWALWHLPSMIGLGQPIGLIICGLIATVAFRIIYFWLHNGTGSLFAIILVHALFNAGRTFFPGGRTSFEQHSAVVGYGIVVVLALTIVAITGVGARRA